MLGRLAARASLARYARQSYFGWSIVLSSAVVYALMGGLNYSGLSLYFLPLAREFGVSHTRVSLIFSLRSILDMFSGPIGGLMVDKLGPRFMVAGGMILGGLGFILLALTRSYLQFLLVLTFLVSLGFSMPDHGVSASINLWFRRRLGLAISIATSGIAIGGFLLTPLIAWLVLGYGWRWAAAVSGLIMLAIGLPQALMFRKPRADETTREDLPASPRQHRGERPIPPAVTSPSPFSNFDFSVREALRTRTYWLLGVSLGLRLVAQSTLMVHIVPILVSKGISEGIAATLLALVALTRLPISIGSGFISDRWSRQRTSAIAMIFGVLACITVLLGARGLVVGIPFALLFGSAQAANGITFALVGQFFGRRNFGTLRGSVSLVPGLTSAIGPVLAGWSYDQTGSYSITLVALAGAYLLAGLIFWNLKAPSTIGKNHFPIGR